jgi:hypothetical protein
LVAATLMLTAAALPAVAQPSGSPPKPATNAAAPATQTPLDTIKALAQAERQAMQSDLAWTGKYNGLINGEASERLVAAIKAFQTGRKSKPTGVLNPQEREQLAAAAKKLQTAVGWKLLGDARSGVRLGLPTRLVPRPSSDASGPQWSSASGAIRIAVTRRQQAGISTAAVAAQLRTEPAGRKVSYSTVKPDFFVLSGTEADKSFYVRGQLRGDEVRILSIVYDAASKAVMEPVVIAMSSAFTPFPTGAQAVGPPPRKSVEYATGIVVSTTGYIVTDRQSIEGCQSIVIAGHGNADRTAEHKAHDLALLRIYGARDLAALALGTAAAKSDVTLTGIADPQNQAGGSAVSSAEATVTPGGHNGEMALSPAPGPGFSGAAALDADGAFAGMALLKPVVVAGPSTATPATQAVLVGVNAVRDFLKTNNVAANGTSKNAKAAVVRVICVRK